MCKGQWPGTAIGGDWRNKTEHCRIWFRLYELLEQEMLLAGEHPLSTVPHRNAVETALVEAGLWGKTSAYRRHLER